MNINNFSDFLEVINKLDGEELEQFAVDRLGYLELNSKVEQIEESLNLDRIYKGYINSNTPIKTSNITEPFYVDDVRLYVHFTKYLKSIKQLKDGPVVLFHLQQYIARLFGLHGNESNRQRVYVKHYNLMERGEIPKDAHLSISNFYRNHSALCVEKSAVVQNLLSFVGMKSYMINSKLENENGVGPHSYNIVQPKDNQYVLFDVTNPITLVDENTNEKMLKAAYVGLDDKPSEVVEFDFARLKLPPNYKVVHEKERKYYIPYDLDLTYDKYQEKTK